MSKTVNVKVSKEKLLAALNRALDKKVKEAAEYKAASEARNAMIEDIKVTIAERIKAGKMTPTSVEFPHYYGRHHYDKKIKAVSVEFELDMEIPDVPSFSDHQNTNEQDELRNAIRILELSDEEFVRTSSYGSVARYL